MAEKKKNPAPRKSEKPVAGPGASGTAIPAGERQPGATAAPQPSDGAEQRAAFEAGIRLFHARNLKEARVFFLQATAGPERDVAQRAQLHAAMCDRRLQSAPILRTAEEYYNYGVLLINARDAGGARRHLEAALRLSPAADHIHYALGVAQALAGDLAGAHESVRRAIELEPHNRIIARQDADLAALTGQPAFEALLYPEKKIW